MADQKKTACGCGCSPIIKVSLPVVKAGDQEKGREGKPE